MASPRARPPACTKTAKKRGLARVRGGKGTASRTVGLLGAIFSYARPPSMRADNPAHGVMRFADGRRERRLSDREYKMLGTALGEGRGCASLLAGSCCGRPLPPPSLAAVSARP